MDFISEIGLFTLKTLVIFAFFAGIIILIGTMALKSQLKGSLEIDKLNEKFDLYKNALNSKILEKEDLKALQKEEKKKSQLEKKSKKNTSTSDAEKKSKLYVVDFTGDTKASQVENLREEITAILTVATDKDEVLVNVESPGGVVHGYGLAASELLRVREKGIPLTISIDKVAASGGYLMACTANKIICAPFGIVGSIGVVAQVPNFHRILKKHEVDYKEYTAGDYKRTVSLLGEITPKGEEKFKEQLEQTHVLFKSFVSKNRPHLDILKVATGEYWYGEQAIELGLVDQIKTSDDYIMDASLTKSILKIKHEKKHGLSEKISNILGQSFEKAFDKIITKMEPLNLIK